MDEMILKQKNLELRFSKKGLEIRINGVSVTGGVQPYFELEAETLGQYSPREANICLTGDETLLSARYISPDGLVSIRTDAAQDPDGIRLIYTAAIRWPDTPQKTRLKPCCCAA